MDEQKGVAVKIEDSQTVTLTPGMAGFSLQAGEEILRAREEGRLRGRAEVLAAIGKMVNAMADDPTLSL